MPEALLRAALDDVGTINAFFHVETEPTGEDWRPLGDLCRAATLASRVADVRARLAQRAGVGREEVEPRVAASIMQQGLASRFLSPMVGLALCHGHTPHPDALRWRPAAGMLPLALDPEGPVTALRGGHAPDPAAQLVVEQVLHGVLAPINAALRTHVKVAPRLLWGNAASSLAGAVAALGAARPRLADRAIALGRAVMTRAPLAGLGRFTNDASGQPFIRATCCLYYRIPTCGTCGDCALAPRDSA